jgi:hypothetical protein
MYCDHFRGSSVGCLIQKAGVRSDHTSSSPPPIAASPDRIDHSSSLVTTSCRAHSRCTPSSCVTPVAPSVPTSMPKPRRWPCQTRVGTGGRPPATIACRAAGASGPKYRIGRSEISSLRGAPGCSSRRQRSWLGRCSSSMGCRPSLGLSACPMAMVDRLRVRIPTVWYHSHANRLVPTNAAPKCRTPRASGRWRQWCSGRSRLYTSAAFPPSSFFRVS